MPLLKKIDDDLKSALKASDNLRVSALRMVKAAVKNKEIDKGGELSDDDIISVISSLTKQRRESIDLFLRGGRQDLADRESRELEILQYYLPKQLTPEEIDQIIVEAIKESSARGVGDMGKIMRLVMPRVKGLADGKIVNQRVKDLLQRE
ncbi:MAG: GatB/YqeY domain-containing protein [Nitrospirota bacterium]